MCPVQCSYKQKRHCCILNRISNNSRAWFRISYWQFSIEFLNSQFRVQLQMTEAEYYVSIADFLWYPRLYDRDSQHIWLGKTSESIRSLDDKCWWWIPLSAPGWGHVETSAANRLIGEVVQSRWRPLLGHSPGWKRLPALSHLRHY